MEVFTSYTAGDSGEQPSMLPGSDLFWHLKENLYGRNILTKELPINCIPSAVNADYEQQNKSQHNHGSAEPPQ